MVTCRDILNLNLDGVKLIGGEKGLDRLVSWSYMVQTRPYAEHMNQGNFAMIVVDYVRFDFDEVRKTMEELVKEIPKYTETEEIDQDLLLAAGEYSREEKNEDAGEEQPAEEKKENEENKN